MKDQLRVHNKMNFELTRADLMGIMIFINLTKAQKKQAPQVPIRDRCDQIHTVFWALSPVPIFHSVHFWSGHMLLHSHMQPWLSLSFLSGLFTFFPSLVLMKTFWSFLITWWKFIMLLCNQPVPWSYKTVPAKGSWQWFTFSGRDTPCAEAALHVQCSLQLLAVSSTPTKHPGAIQHIVRKMPKPLCALYFELCLSQPWQCVIFIKEDMLVKQIWILVAGPSRDFFDIAAL